MRRISSKPRVPSTTMPSVEPGQLTDSAVRDVYNQIGRLFLTGTISNSFFVDVTNISDQKTFVRELQEVCGGKRHLWSVSANFRRQYSRNYAEISVSPSTYRTFKDISLSGLPSQYSREIGGLAQLHADMELNMGHFGHVIDSVLVESTAGVFHGMGYVVHKTKSSKHNSPIQPLSHLVDWTYFPIDFSADDDNTLLNKYDRIQIKATWASMPPFCRYCHSSDHALVDCSLRRKAIICFNCHEAGHISGSCPRKNSSTGKKRKTTTNQSVVPSLPPPSSTTTTTTTESIPVTVDAALAVECSLAVSPSSSLEVSSPPASLNNLSVSLLATRVSHRIQERQATHDISSPDSILDSQSVAVCRHCGLEGHSRTTSRHCFKNPKLLAEFESTLNSSSSEMVGYDVVMEDELPLTQLIADSVLEADTETSISTPLTNQLFIEF
ncbi:hypothetical protein A0J61_10895 [Choanephora cucurbitarum]|uniref:CCHC-type domain-containing protein n=1 Tax=Choanephora cucurbitarum TaxID=101091 RepID=A0A1C7MW70_9FUNG|nr:hypothetical protein A0J61_10895 [Choanephora cucurbitarum]